MRVEMVGRFEVVPGELRWPWLSFADGGRLVALPAGPRLVRVHRVEAAFPVVAEVALPPGAALPTEPSGDVPAWQPGLHAATVDAAGARVALAWVEDGDGRVAVLNASGAIVASRSTRELLGPEYGPNTLRFSSDGAALWLSLDGPPGAAYDALVVLDAASLEPLGVAREDQFPPPSYHDLVPHPRDGSVLLAASSGPDGTWAHRALVDGGGARLTHSFAGDAAPFGVSLAPDGRAALFVEQAALSLHAWPDLALRRRRALPDGDVSHFSAALVDRVALVPVTSEATDSDEADLAVFDLDTLEPLGTLPFTDAMLAGACGGLVVAVRAHGGGAGRAGELWQFTA